VRARRRNRHEGRAVAAGAARLALSVLWLAASPAAGRDGAPPELGAVAWERDFARAEASARSTGRPLFALFQEVPGCQTCVSFGEQVLSHPLLVESIESDFVPVAIYNNLGGADGRVLERFGEPAWNNPVVRFLDAGGRDLIARRDGLWFPRAIARRMVAALEKGDRPVPGYLRDLVAELSAARSERATFAMHCFWSGEACLGEIDGVLGSRAGWLDGREVVEVRFDPAVLSYEGLLGEAHRRGCSDRVLTHSDAQQRAAAEVFGDRVVRVRAYASPAQESDQKRALLGTPYRALALTPAQAVRVNAAVAAGRSPARWLSPRQRERAAAPAGPASP